ncbi:MAG TPA: transcriptional repressor [Blastocatellia bacterium]|nr:transcriptional repressor [Blastocatellia bacterium]
MTEDLRSKLETRGCSFTRQRAAVFDYLGSVDTHPTAEQVFMAIKKTLPRVSLATVYKNLEALIDCGLASKLTYGDGSARYDIRTDHHYHTRCLECGQVRDVEPGRASSVLKQIMPATAFEVTGYRLELLGYCGRCASRKDRRGK